MRRQEGSQGRRALLRGWSPGASASGLRPASAFVLILCVLLVAAAKAAHITLYAGGSQPDAIREEQAPRTSFDIVDRCGVPLAVSVECFDLTLSPRAMWRSHTPRYMAERIASVLGEDVDPTELLGRMLPGQHARGSGSNTAAARDAGSADLVFVDEPRALLLTREGAVRVRDWINSGPFEGFWLAHRPSDDRWTLAWDPVNALSKATRLRHQPENERRPERWTRFLLNGLVDAIGEEDLCALEPERLGGCGAGERRAALRDMLWAELLPSQFRVVRTRIDPGVAHSLTQLFVEEAVSSWQMNLEPRLDRRYPVRLGCGSGLGGRDLKDGPPVALLEAEGAREPSEFPQVGGFLAPDPFSILGSWGVLDVTAAARLARADLAQEPAAKSWDRELRLDFLEKRFLAHQSGRKPRNGIELAALRELEQPYWDGVLESGSRMYGRRVRHLPRDCRQRWEDRIPDYFEHAEDAPEHPRVVASLDADLQRYLHLELQRTLREHAAAVAMGVVVDVESASVLAVDGVSPYETSGFLPVRHTFTPGSTLKAAVMAIAHDAGYVEAHETFETFAPGSLVVRDEGGCARSIREALGAPDEPVISAEVGLARSVNAVLVQIGLRVPAALLRERLTQLGYGSAPVSGLGHDVSGRLPELTRGGWSRCYTHASISFGHEISVSLWQHAAALATIARGGTYRPLRLIEGMEQHGQRWDLPLQEERTERVLSERSCEVVRSMMASGAEWGTGRNVASFEHCPEFAYLGTKTGTTEKVESELCTHVELAHQVGHVEDATSCSVACRRALKGERYHQGTRRTCYTSSMWAVGRLPGADARELMVLLVVDDPGAKKKYGSDVAGPAAVRVLRRALGLVDAPAAVETASELAPLAFNQLDAPWTGEGGGE